MLAPEIPFALHKAGCNLLLMNLLLNNVLARKFSPIWKDIVMSITSFP